MQATATLNGSALVVLHDGPVWISEGKSRKEIRWKNKECSFSELVERLSETHTTPETYREYTRMSKADQGARKDVGGFVGGFVRGGRRKSGAIDDRSLITLDADFVKGDIWATVQTKCPYAVVMYSTHSHSPESPRVRIVIPLSRTVSPDEYQAVSRRVASDIGIDFFDETTFEPHRLMYWPSTSIDGEFLFHFQDAPWVNPDDILSRYADWKDPTSWPGLQKAEQAHRQAAAKQGDPTTKPGAVGLFCRAYTVPGAIESFLSDTYTEAGEGRYSYIPGSTGAGLILYENDTFAYSHHGSDPAGGRLVNAFDLVRLHRFGELDDSAKEDTPVNKLPSYRAMRNFANQDKGVAALRNQEQFRQIEDEFGDVLPEEADSDWMLRLDRNPDTGALQKSLKNVQTFLQHDPLLKGRIFRDSFADQLMGVAPLPWGARRTSNGPFQWADEDDSGLAVYLDRSLGSMSTSAIGNALNDHAAGHRSNAVEAYLLGLKWDGKPRLETLYIDYFGADDHPYTRAVARKALAAAVARAMTHSANPKMKFDTMTVVDGIQGIGKSTLFAKLGKQWFSDSIKSFEHKEAEELTRGAWIVEIAEMQAFHRADINRIKQFLSKLEDQYRPAFGRHVRKQIRRCVFFGTTNNQEYLRDPSGNRRFWPVNALVQDPKKSVFDDLTETIVDQIWAEAVVVWRQGEPLYLDSELEKEAERRREAHFESDPREGLIRIFIERLVPSDWSRRTIEERRRYDPESFGETEVEMISRDRICATEIWCECLGGDPRHMKRTDAIAINSILDTTPGWKKCKDVTRFGPYGRVKGGYVRA